jgi:hypothetical protein
MIIRSAKLEDATGIAKVRIDTWRTTYRDIVPSEFLNGMSYEEDMPALDSPLKRS